MHLATCAARPPTSASSLRVYVARAVRQALDGQAERAALMATSTMHAAESARRSAARCRGSRRATRSPGAPNTPTPCACPACCTRKIFRSTVAHGRIKSIDTSAARKVPGVYRVVTSDDVRKVIPEPYYGPAFHDQPILAIDKVHYVGEPVAVVLAADPHVAEEAAQLIVAEYEELPAVFDEVEALTTRRWCTRS